MKAAIIKELGQTPVYSDHPDPVPANETELLMNVKAASVKNLDKLRASGKHYASYTELPAVAGIDGVGTLEDGTLVYAQGISGTLAEQALIRKGQYVVVPQGLDIIQAAALPNAVIGAAMALRFRAKMKKEDVVLINGATGVTGKLAVQLAKHDGASKIIVTGRNKSVLEELRGLGADEVISLLDSDEAIIERLKSIHRETPISCVIDYLWGKPVELIISALKGGGVNSFTPQVKIVTVGSMAGENISLGSGTLRSSAIEILGSGLGSLSREDLHRFYKEVLPEIFELAKDGKLKLDTYTAPLSEVEKAWELALEGGVRLVISVD
ncbi:zinc-binding dehydrogenase [Fluviicola sp.]|uniref:quinone oxidoreductase family protein n=1 Tax=Fluviicola sp. TaxID=1917219 RepID=UPI0031DC2B62